MLGVSHLDTEFCSGNGDSGEEGKGQKAFAMTKNACKPCEVGEDQIGDYCKTANSDLALENCHC